MANFDFKNMRADAHLTNIALATMNEPGDYIADKILPPLKVNEKTGLIADYGTVWMTIIDDKKGTRSEYNTLRFRVESDKTYALKDHGLIAEIFEDDYKNYKLPVDLDEIETISMVETMRINKEFAVLSMFNSSVITSSYTALSGSSRFDQYTTSDPIRNIWALLIDAVRTAWGKRPNLLVVWYDVISILQFHPKVIERFGGLQSAIGRGKVVEFLKEEFMVDVLVPSTLQHNGTTFAELFSKKVAALVVDNNPGKQKNVFGYQFTEFGWAKTYKMNLANTVHGFKTEAQTLLKVRENRDFKILNIKCAGMLDTVLS